MKLWIGGEIAVDVTDGFREARLAVEKTINSEIEGVDYNIDLEGWDCIAIIRDDQQFEERVRYSKKKRDMDFRLCIDHAQFFAADLIARESMLIKMLFRSLILLEEKGVAVDRLKSDLLSIAQRKGWFSGGSGSTLEN